MNHYITIKGQKFELTTKEAKALYEELAAVFGKRITERPFPVCPPEPMFRKTSPCRIIGPIRLQPLVRVK